MAGEKQIASVKDTARSFPASPTEQGVSFHGLVAPHSGLDAEQHQLLAQWNDTQANFPRDKCVHELFETQVERTPNAVALVNSKGAVSYRELDYQANRVAIHLRSLFLLIQKALAGHFQFQIPNCREVCLGSLRQPSGKTRRKSPPGVKAATDNLAFVIDTLSFNAGAEMAMHN